MSELQNEPLQNIVYISIPEDAKREINGFTLNPKKLIPIEIPEDREKWTFEELSWEMIVSAMLKIFAYKPEHEDIEYYRSFIQAVQPNLVAELTQTGIIKAEAKDFALAEEIFLALCHLAPEEETTFLNLAFAYEEQYDALFDDGDMKGAEAVADKALGTYLEALEAHPDSVDVHFYFGYFNLKQSNLSKALEYFELFLGLAVDDERAPEVQNIVSSIRNQNQDDDQFTEAFSQIKNGNEPEAISLIDDFLERHDDVWNAWFLKGWAHRRLGEYAEGKSALEHALELEQGNVDIFNELAICCMETGELEGARKYLNRALVIEPDNVKIVSNLGILELKRDDTAAALHYFTIAAELDPADKIAQQYIKALS